MKCSCKRVAPYCEHCREIRRKLYRKHYTTAKRRERARREREASKLGSTVRYGDLDIAFAEKILAKKPPSRAVTWLELSAGRSNT